MTYDLGIIGAGNMAEAIARGVLRAGLLQPSQIIAADVALPRRELFEKALGIQSVADNATVAAQSRQIACCSSVLLGSHGVSQSHIRSFKQ